MKKFYVILVVLALVCISSIAFAADVTMGGAVQIRSRDFDNLITLPLSPATGNPNPTSVDQMDTQTRVIINANAKAGDIQGKISLWNDFNDWGGNSGGRENVLGVGFGNSGSDGPAFGFREAWILFPVVDTGFTIKGGHQLLQLGQGGFFRSQHFGSDAWVLFRDDGPNHFGVVNVKAAEGNLGQSDDIDAYVLVDTFKINDNNKVGIDLTYIKDRRALLSLNSAATTSVNSIYFTGAGAGSNAFKLIELQNIGLNYTGKMGPLNLRAEVDLQMGKASGSTGITDAKFKGNMIWIAGDVAFDPMSVNFTLARGSGQKKDGNDIDQFVPLLDVDPHYTFLYEYKINTAASNFVTGAPSSNNTGFANTTALNLGATMKATKNLSIGANLWFLQATEKVTNAQGEDTNEIGNEIDAKISWKLGESLVWNWDLGYFMPGKMYNKANGDKMDAATGIMGVLAFTF